MPRHLGTAESRFWAKVNKSPGLGRNGDCWEWIAADNGNGYGYSVRLRDGGSMLAHRISYEMKCGPIPNGLVLLHSCDNRKCVNPAHLSIGTTRDNIMDMVAKGRHVSPQRSMTHCKHGHEFTPENTRIRTCGIKRTCIACETARLAQAWVHKRDSLNIKPRKYSNQTPTPNTHERI